MKSIKYIITIFISLYAFASCYATSYTWNGNTSSAWATTTNFTPNGTPGVNDTVQIVTSSHNPVLSANVTVKNFKMTSGTLDLNGDTLTINNTCNFNGGTINSSTGNGLIRPRGTNAFYSGTTFNVSIDAVCGTNRFNGSIFYSAVNFEDTTNAAVTSDGGNVFHSSVTIKKSGTGGGIWNIGSLNGNTFNGDLTILNYGTKEIQLSDTGTNAYNGNIVVGCNNTGGIYFGSTKGGKSILASGKTITIAGLGFSSGTLLLRDFVPAGSTSQSITLTGTGVINLINDTLNANVTLSAPSVLLKTTIFNGTSDITHTGSVRSDSYGSNKFNGATTITLTGTANMRLGVTGSDYFNGAVSFTGSGSGTINPGYGTEVFFSGNLTKSGNVGFEASAGIATFTGASAQTINADSIILFKNLRINKSANDVTLNKNIRIDSLLNFVKGKIISTTTNAVNVYVDADVTGASDSSFVSGVVKKKGNNQFIFPTGKSTRYRPIEMSAPAVSTDNFSAEYFDNAQGLGNSMDASLKYISQCNYWQLDRIGGTSSISVKLSWDSTSCPLLDSVSARVGNWNGTIWKDLGNGGITGNRYVGKIANSTGVYAYNYFVIGYNQCFITANAGADQSICAGDSVTIGGSPVANNGTGSYSYSWTPSTGLSATSVANPKASPSSTTDYIVTVTDANGCTNKDTVTITYHGRPTANAGTDQSVCPADSVTIGGAPTGSGSTSPYTYSWAPSSGLSNAAAANPKASPASTTNYIVTVTDTYGCSKNDTVVVTLYSSLSVTVAGDGNNGDTAIAHASGGSTPYTFAWSPGGATDSIAAGLSYGNIYTVVVTDAHGCTVSGRFNHIFSKLTTGPLVTDSNNTYFATWGDYDNDGDVDLFQPSYFSSANNTNGNSLMFQNNCNGNLTKIQKIPVDLVTDGAVGSAYWIDYDNDGDLDMYAGAGILYQNNGNGSFQKVSKVITNLASYTTAIRDAGFADYNNDGYLDVYFGKDSIYSGNSSADFVPHGGSPFSSVSGSYRADAITWADYDNDGYMDMYVTNSNGVNYLYHNNGNGTFTSITSNTDLIANKNSYGAAWADYDNDGNLDLWEACNTVANRLYHNNGNGTFTLVTTGDIATTSTTSQAGASWADYDNDGDLDLFVPTFTKNLLFNNNGNGTFTKITSEIPAADVTVESYGGAWADYDNDGDLDLMVPTAFGNPNDMFYINNICNSGASDRNWVKFHLTGVTSNRDAIGARIYIKATINGVANWQMREVNANTTRGGESGGASGHVVHFGIGNATVIDSIKIVWPASSTTKIYTSVTINKFYEAAENSSSLIEEKACLPDLPIQNPGFIHGKIFNDINSNCTYEAGIDYPIVNKFVQAEPGTYFTFTNDSGDYTLDLPAGNFNISTNFNNDIWDLSSCQSDSLINLSVTENDTIQNIDFSQQARIIPCDSFYTLTITSIGIDTCSNGIIFSTPCPLHYHEYCFTIENHSSLPSESLTVASINFPPGFIIQTGSITISPPSAYTTSYPNTHHVNITITNPINSGQVYQICMIVYVTSISPPLDIDFNHNNPGTAVNLINNADFEGGTAINSSYANVCGGPPSSQGEYCVGTDPSLSNNGWIGTPHGGSNFLFADGSSVANTAVWQQTNVGVNVNTRYRFSGFFTNIVNTPANLTNPNLSFVVNGGQLLPAFTFPENPNVWLYRSRLWCSDSDTIANISIQSNDLGLQGNDFGLDDLEFIERRAKGTTLTEPDTCGCDPNNKLVTPVGCGPQGNISKQDKLTYTIHFLNTGTGNAHNIVIRDVINKNLNISTFTLIASSHTITKIDIIPDTVLIISFDNIELEPDSSAFVTFRINQTQGLTDGTQITNQAGIYFDNNGVVLTNITLNTVFDNPEPEAIFSYKHNCSNSGRGYDFTYTGNTSDNASYLWTFTNGSPSTSTDENPLNIVFSSTGYKQISLTITRNGCTSLVVDSVLISNINVGDDSIKICHFGTEIIIHIDSITSHLSHGDCLGKCTYQNRMAQSTQIDSTSQLSIRISPNPVSDICLIQIAGNSEINDNLSIELLNFTGNEVENIYNGPINTNDNYLLQLKLGTKNLASGLYLIRTKFGSEIAIAKLIIQH